MSVSVATTWPLSQRLASQRATDPAPAPSSRHRHDSSIPRCSSIPVVSGSSARSSSCSRCSSVGTSWPSTPAPYRSEDEPSMRPSLWLVLRVRASGSDFIWPFLSAVSDRFVCAIQSMHRTTRSRSFTDPGPSRQTSMRSPPASNAARAVRTSAYTPSRTRTATEARRPPVRARTGAQGACSPPGPLSDRAASGRGRRSGRPRRGRRRDHGVRDDRLDEPAPSVRAP